MLMYLYSQNQTAHTLENQSLYISRRTCTGSSHICTKLCTLLLKACPLEIMLGRGKNFSIIRWIGYSGGRGDDGNHLTLKDQDPIILGDIDEVPVQQCYQFLKSMATCTQCFNFQWCFTITLFDSNLLQLGERIINVQQQDIARRYIIDI